MFSNLLNGTKGFTHQITLKVVLKKYKPNGGIEFRPVYIYSATKAMINHNSSLNTLTFQLTDHYQGVLT